MSFLDKLERLFGRFAIPNLTLYFVIGQVFVLLSYLAGVLSLQPFVLVPVLVYQGDWWRVLSFMLMPPPPGMFGYLLIAFAWYLFYLMGNALEHYWGTFRYNLFIFTGWALIQGREWARFVTVILVFLSAISHLLDLTSQPYLSILMIAIDLVILYAVTVRWEAAKIGMGD